jgi:hypothetical protein
MSVRKEFDKLKELGRLPDADDEMPDGLLEEFQELLDKIKKPITQEEAAILIKIFPEKACFGAEWTLVNLIESTPNWPLGQVIELCPSDEWKNQLLWRANQ